MAGEVCRSNGAEDGIRTDSHGKRGQGTGVSLAAEAQAEQLEGVVQPASAPGIRGSHAGQAFGEDATATVGGVTEEAVERELESDRRPAPGQVGQRPLVGTVDTRGPLVTQRASGRIGGTGDEQGDDVGIEANEIKSEMGGIGEEG